MAYGSRYTFNKVFNKNGSRSKWAQVVVFLANNGPSSKREILDAIYPNRGDVVDRGYCSTMFANLNESIYVHYNSADRKWYANDILEHMFYKPNICA